jgi:predicted RNase H-like HicB family nuclease
MKYVYPVVLTPEDGKVLVNVPDLPTIYTFGDDLADALEMAKDALEMWLWDQENKNCAPPPASAFAEIARHCATEQSVSLVIADTTAYRRQVETRSA